MLKAELVSVLEASSLWTKDRYGHFHCEDRRFKMLDRACRFEKKMGSGEWLNTTSDYYKNMKIVEGKIVIGNLKISV